MIRNYNKRKICQSLTEISKFQMEEMCKNPIENFLNEICSTDNEKENVKNNFDITSHISEDGSALTIIFDCKCNKNY